MTKGGKKKENPMFDLTGKFALVTGASGGIGSSIAEALHAQGATVCLSGTRREALEAVAAKLGSRTQLVTANLSDRASVEALVPEAEKAMGGLDILVNNAGITRDNLFMRMKDEEWDSVLAVNLTSSFILARAAVKGMMKRRFGRIINITSVVGAIGNAGQVNYAAAKAGVAGLTRSLARELGGRSITVNCVAPGFIATDMTHGLPDAVKAAMLAQIPVGRLGAAEEVAHAVVFLASREAAYITGTELHVNGGMHMG